MFRKEIAFQLQPRKQVPNPPPPHPASPQPISSVNLEKGSSYPRLEMLGRDEDTSYLLTLRALHLREHRVHSENGKRKPQRQKDHDCQVQVSVDNLIDIKKSLKALNHESYYSADQENSLQAELIQAETKICRKYILADGFEGLEEVQIKNVENPPRFVS